LIASNIPSGLGNWQGVRVSGNIQAFCRTFVKSNNKKKRTKEREAIQEMDTNVQNSQNVQDGFLNNLRRDRVNVTIYLMGGVKLTGKIRSFDKFSLVLESGNLEQLIFKHAISTISVPRGSFHHGPREGQSREGGYQPQPHGVQGAHSGPPSTQGGGTPSASSAGSAG
jgi:host factor-I protein